MLRIESRLQEIGKIKIGMKGEKAQSSGGKGFSMPKKLDHFVVTQNVRNNDGNYEIDGEVMKALGPKPEKIDVVLFSDRIEDNWESYRAAYVGAGKCFCRSEDEEIASRAKTQTAADGRRYVTAEREEIRCPGKKCEFANPDAAGITLCKPHGKLSVLLPESQQIGGVYTFRTTSWETIQNIQSQLDIISRLTKGVLAGLRFQLRISPVTKPYTNKDGNQAMTTFWTVGLFYVGDVTELYRQVEEYTRMIFAGRAQLFQAHERRRQIADERFEIDADAVDEFNPAAREIETPELERDVSGEAQEIQPEPEPEPEHIEKPETAKKTKKPSQGSLL